MRSTSNGRDSDGSLGQPEELSDESGDSTFYDGNGKLIVGTEGCSPLLILWIHRSGNISGCRRDRRRRYRAGLLDGFF